MSKYENRSFEERHTASTLTVSDAYLTKPEPIVSIKHDQEKPAVQYIPAEALFAMGEAYGYGARKYGGHNFQITGLEVSRCLAASVRHIYLFLSGENLDKESGLSHLGHAMAAIGMAIYSLQHHPSKDDRFKKGQSNA